MTHIIAGLRRSGTSMMMLALKEAGLKIHGQKFDNDTIKAGNPNGYWETEATTKGLTKDLGQGVVKVMCEAVPFSNPELIDKTIIMFREPKAILASWSKYNHIANKELYITNCILDIIKTLEFLKDYRIIRYEDVIANPEKEMKKVCEYMGGDYKKASTVVDKSLSRSTPRNENIKSLAIMEKIYNLNEPNKIIAMKDSVLYLKDFLNESSN